MEFNGSVLGKIYYMGKQLLYVVGIVDMLSMFNGWNDNWMNFMLLFMWCIFDEGGIYVLCILLECCQEVFDVGVVVLECNDFNWLMCDKLIYEDQCKDFFKNDCVMVGLLIIVSVLLLVVIVLGIIGLVSFWVQQCSKQIGICCVFGVIRGQILCYFQIENFLLVLLGIVLGMLVVYVINLVLMNLYELLCMFLYYLLLGVLLLWVLGQVVVFGLVWWVVVVLFVVVMWGV